MTTAIFIGFYMLAYVFATHYGIDNNFTFALENNTYHISTLMGIFVLYDVIRLIFNSK